MTESLPARPLPSLLSDLTIQTEFDFTVVLVRPGLYSAISILNQSTLTMVE